MTLAGNCMLIVLFKNYTFVSLKLGCKNGQFLQFIFAVLLVKHIQYPTSTV